MKRRTSLPELLAPAGDMSALCAAILGGADAIYVGGLRFGARAFAKNFSEEEMKLAVKLCHLFGVRLYVTLNTLIFDKEADDAVAYARTLHDIGIDALIVADLGITDRIRKEIPELELHASTQMGVHNRAGVDFAAALGCKRVVLARECSGEDIKRIVNESSAECEVFLHGALCVCHSGQCLFSSMVGGRSGNRGECAQPCRLPYANGRYPLSLKDLSLSGYVRDLIDSGVSSLKIEGRMKSADYVYEVTRIYRSLLDERRNSLPDERKRLAEVFSRGGFTDGYFTGKLFSNMTGIRTDSDKRQSKEFSGGSFDLPKIKLTAKASFKVGERSSFEIFLDNVEARWERTKLPQIAATAYGDVPNEAQNAPLTEQALAARLSKMGNTPFSLSEEDVDVMLDGGLNLPPSVINALRRDAVAELEKKLLSPIRSLIGTDEAGTDPSALVKFNSPTDSLKSGRLTTAQFFSARALDELLKKGSPALSSIDVAFVPLFDYSDRFSSAEGIEVGVYIPPIVMESEWNEVRREVLAVEKKGAKYALVGNVSHAELLYGTRFEAIGDFRLNVANKYTKAVYGSFGLSRTVLSPELTLPMVRDIKDGAVTLGRIPLMITERCFTKENFGCDKCGKAAFTDRKGAKFPLLREYKHRSVIFNSSPTYMGDKKDELRAAGVVHRHFIFSVESADGIERLVLANERGECLDAPHRRIGKR